MGKRSRIQNKKQYICLCIFVLLKMDKKILSKTLSKILCRFFIIEIIEIYSIPFNQKKEKRLSFSFNASSQRFVIQYFFYQLDCELALHPQTSMDCEHAFAPPNINWAVNMRCTPKHQLDCEHALHPQTFNPTVKPKKIADCS